MNFMATVFLLNYDLATDLLLDRIISDKSEISNF